MKKKLALFDFDKTLRGGDSMFALLFWTLKRYPSKMPITFLRILKGTFIYILSGLNNICSLKNSIFSVVRYLKQEDLDLFTEKILLNKRMYVNGIEEIKKNFSENYEILIVSASPELYLMSLKNFLPIREVIGTKIDSNGNIVGNNCKSLEKVKRIQAFLEKENWELDYENSKGYTDSPSADGPMLSLVKNKYLINSKKKLEGYLNLDWR